MDVAAVECTSTSGYLQSWMKMSRLLFIIITASARRKMYFLQFLSILPVVLWRFCYILFSLFKLCGLDFRLISLFIVIGKFINHSVISWLSQDDLRLEVLPKLLYCIHMALKVSRVKMKLRLEVLSIILKTVLLIWKEQERCMKTKDSSKEIIWFHGLFE